MQPNPPHYRYSRSHEWLDTDGDEGRVGITAYAAEALGDVVFVELPDVGADVVAGTACAEVESTKSVSDVNSPASGTVVAVNDAVVEDPSLINTDPFGDGWLFRLRLSDDAADLLDQAGYAATTEDH